MLRVGFEPTPFRTRTLIWRLRPTRPSQLDGRRLHELYKTIEIAVTRNRYIICTAARSGQFSLKHGSELGSCRCDELATGLLLSVPLTQMLLLAGK